MTRGKDSEVGCHWKVRVLMRKVGCWGQTVPGRGTGWGDKGGYSLGGTNPAKSRRVSPGRSSPRGSSSPLGGSCYPRRTPSPPAGPAGAAPHPGRPPPGPAQPLPPPCALRPPNRGGGDGARGGAGRRGPGPGSAGDRVGERGRARGAGGAQLPSPAARRVPAARSAAGNDPSSSSSPLGQARLPGAPGSLRALARHAFSGSTWGTVAAPPGPRGPELFLGRYERQWGGGGLRAGGASSSLLRGGSPLPLRGSRRRLGVSGKHSDRPRPQSSGTRTLRPPSERLAQVRALRSPVASAVVPAAPDPLLGSAVPPDCCCIPSGRRAAAAAAAGAQAAAVGSAAVASPHRLARSGAFPAPAPPRPEHSAGAEALRPSRSWQLCSRSVRGGDGEGGRGLPRSGLPAAGVRGPRAALSPLGECLGSGDSPPLPPPLPPPAPSPAAPADPQKGSGLRGLLLCAATMVRSEWQGGDESAGAASSGGGAPLARRVPPPHALGSARLPRPRAPAAPGVAARWAGRSGCRGVAAPSDELARAPHNLAPWTRRESRRTGPVLVNHFEPKGWLLAASGDKSSKDWFCLFVPRCRESVPRLPFVLTLAPSDTYLNDHQIKEMETCQCQH